MTTLTLDSVITRNGEIQFAVVDNEVVMLSMENSKYYGARHVGRRIWELIEQPASVAAVCNQLLQEFDVDAATCEAEVLAFLAQLQAQNLIKLG